MSKTFLTEQPQTLTPEQQAQARLNIGAAAIGEGGGASPDAVLYTFQVLSAEQQAQARDNVGAVSVAEVTAIVDAKISSITNAEEVAY